MIRLIESEIRELKLKLLDMADLVRLQLDNTCAALPALDREQAERVVRREAEIDKFDNKIHKRCERIIALYQPVANDLRFVFSVLRINAFLEQTGDAISGIASRIRKLQAPLPPDAAAELRLAELSELTKNILYAALRAYFKEDADSARAIFAYDDAIDEINADAFHVVVRHIQADPARTADYVHTLNVIKSFEKVGDHAVAIAEEALFLIEGTVYRHTDLKHAHKTGSAKPADADSAGGLAVA